MKRKSLLFLLLMAMFAPLAMNGQGTLTVCDGTEENQYIPFYAYSGDTQGTTSEFIIPESNLTALNGKTITALKFYLSQSQSKTWTAVYQVYMTEVATTQLTRTIGPDAGTVVYQGTVDASGSEMTITFNQGNYTYNGGHLLIGTYVATDGAWDSNGKFYGITATAASYLSGSWGGYDDGGFDFIPKTTFSYLSDDPYITLAPASATVLTGFTQTLTATYGNVSGTPTITYSSSNTNVATVSGSGTTATVTGVAPGIATITATMNGSYTATCAITVENPSYCTPSFGSNDDCITNITLGDINNTTASSSTNGYGDYTSMSTELEPGTTATLSLTSGAGTGAHAAAVWIDFNDNYVFESSERVGTQDNISGSTTVSISLAIPSDAAVGNHRLRVVYQYYTTATDINPCASATFGEAEDYTVIIDAACAVPTGLTVELMGNAAELSWTGATDTYNVQYHEVDPTAPATIILNIPSDVWGDGSGYQMLIDADATAYGTIIPETGGLTSSGDASAATYAEFEYKLPSNADGSCTTTNILVEGSISIEIPAGTYDWCITNPTPGDRIWIASSNGNVNGRQDDYVFEPGMTYEFTIHVSGNYDAVDVTITDNNAWTLVEGVNNPYLLENLSSQTTYEFQVQGADCSNWSASATFTTGEFYTKDIAGWDVGEDEDAFNFYLIASPIGDVNPTAVTITSEDPDIPTGVTNMVSGSYDLYYFDHSKDLEWVNYKDANGNPGAFNTLVSGKGYLYANKYDVTLVFTGSAYTTTDGTETIELDYVSGTGIDLPGWNLVGNPFAETAYLAGNCSFYTMKSNGLFAPATNLSIEPMEGIFVEASEAEQTQSVTFTTTQPTKSPALNLNLSNGRKVVDRAIVRFDGGKQLSKLQFREGSTKVYIPVEGHDYAVVNCEEMGELPVSFKAEENGSYNLSLSSEEVSFAYLHLIDNMTGADVDLLQTPSYSFEAKTTDYESRFKLVFATGDNSNDDNFAYFSNGSFVINNEGNAELQVIDLMGRILSSESINGCANVNVNAAPGVYMLRLINGDNVKVQKVVVK